MNEYGRTQPLVICGNGGYALYIFTKVSMVKLLQQVHLPRN